MRKLQPYSGPGEGMHFPLRKDAEVLLAFTDGDPDRPIITSAVPSAEDPSVVTDMNQTKNVFRTAGGNRFEMEDEKGNERILLYTPRHGNFLRLGSHNDPDEEDAETDKWHDYDGLKILGASAAFRITGIKNSTVIGIDTAFNFGATISFTFPFKVDIVLCPFLGKPWARAMGVWDVKLGGFNEVIFGSRHIYCYANIYELVEEDDDRRQETDPNPG